jgi:uncharacterized repeat protein (TIGR01451 family)
VIRIGRFLPLSPALVALASAALTFFTSSRSADAQIMFQTQPWTAPAPMSTAQAISVFDGLTSGAGYGCTLPTTVNGTNNSSQNGGPSSNIAYHVSAVFVVPPAQVGTWAFRWGGDFGFGGTLLVDGVELQSRWSDMWWGGAFTDPAQYLQGSVNLTAGTHIIEVFGFEGCCDGPTDAQFLAPGSSTYLDISTANLQMVAPLCSPSLLVTSSASPNPVLDGGQITYTFKYESTGTAPATSVMLVDPLPANTTFVSASAGGTYDPTGGTVSWSLGALAPGTTGTATMILRVATPLADGTAIADTATLSAANAPSSVATANVTVSNAVLTLTSAAAPNPVAAGAPLTVTLTYKNTGSGVAAAAAIVDVLPANTTFVSATAGGSYDAGMNRVTWSLGDLAMGASGIVSFVVQVASPLTNGTLLSDMASFSATTNTTVTAGSVTTVSSAPAMTFTDLPGANPVAAGASLVYTLRYSNAGTDAAQNVVVTYGLSANVTFASSTGGGIYGSTLNQVVWNLGTVAAGTSGAVTVTVVVASPIANGTVLIDTASLAASNASTLLANASVTVTSAPIVSFTETGAPNPVSAGAQLVYTLAYANSGTDAALGATVAAPIPSNTTFVSATGGGVYDSGTNQVNFTLGNLAPGTNAAVTFTVAVQSPLPNGTSLFASATLSSTNTAAVPAMATTTVQSAPTLSLTDTGTPNPVQAGSQLTYTLAFANHGNDTASDAALTVVLPAGTSFVSASNGGSYAAGTNQVSWNLGNLAASGSGSVTLVVLVDQGLAAGTLSDTAVLTAANSAQVTATAMTSTTAFLLPDAGSRDGGGAGGGSTGTGGGGGGGTSGAAGTAGSGAGGAGGSVAGSSGTGGAGGGGAAGSTGMGGSGVGGNNGGAGGTGGGSSGVGGSTGTGGAGTSGVAGSGGASAGAGGHGGTVGTGGSGTTGGSGGGAGSGGRGGAAGSAGGSTGTGAAGSTGSPDGGKDGPGSGALNPSSGGCGCDVGAVPGRASFLWLLPMLTLVIRRRWRKRSR